MTRFTVYARAVVLSGLFCCLLAKEWLPRCLNSQCETYEEEDNRTLVTSCEPENVGVDDSIKVHHLGKVEVSPQNATCGYSPTKFCAWKNGQSCRTCKINGTKERLHNPEYMVDEIDWRWWQSVLQPFDASGNDMFPINITIRLPMKFILTDNIVITFHESCPRDMFVEKSIDHGRTWVVMQYYSDNCKAVFGMDPVQERSGGKLSGVDGLKAFCIEKSCGEDHVRDPNPPKVTVVISREALKKLSEPDLCRNMIENIEGVRSFLEITDLRIRLLRTATKNKEGGNLELKKHYGIDQVSIKGRCQCNGHASECTYDKDSQTARCKCRHNTAEKDCSKCRTFFWLKPWTQGEYDEELKGHTGLCLSYSSLIYRNKSWRKPYAKTYGEDVYATVKRKGGIQCNCSGHSDRCQKLIIEKKEDKVVEVVSCIECSHNTTGLRCERCKSRFHRVSNNKSDPCTPCICIRINSKGFHCNKTGKCRCKTGAHGMKCGLCIAGYRKNRKGRCTEVKDQPTAKKDDGPSGGSRDLRDKVTRFRSTLLPLFFSFYFVLFNY